MKMRARLTIALAVALLGAAAVPSAEALKVGSGRGGVKLVKQGRFAAPTYVENAPGVRGVFVVEQPGTVRMIRKGKRRKGVFLDIRGLVHTGGEQGLLSIAFPPNYRQSGLFYVYFTNQAGNNEIDEFQRGAKDFVANPASRRVVLEIPHPNQPNHNGGLLQFGPDGFLYAGIGDGGGQGDADDSAQNPDELTGKLLRIDPRQSGPAAYSVPPDNPFVGVAGRDEIYAMGLRNPWRFSFDLISAREPRIVIADVGQARFEEVDYETLAGAKGANFGWNDFEGNSSFSGAHPPPPPRHDRPIFAYPLTGGACSIIGGYVVRNRSLGKIFKRFIYGDFCLGILRTFVPTLGSARKDRKLGLTVPMLSSFGEGQGGAIYATSLRGPVYRLKARKAKKR